MAYFVKGVLRYTKTNTSSFQNHISKNHQRRYTKFVEYINQNSDRDEASPSYVRRACLEKLSNQLKAGQSSHLLNMQKYGETHPKQKIPGQPHTADVKVIQKFSLVQGNYFQTLVSDQFHILEVYFDLFLDKQNMSFCHDCQIIFQ